MGLFGFYFDWLWDCLTIVGLPLEGEVSENWVGISFRQELVDEVTSNEIDGKAAGQKKIYSNLQKAILYYHCNRRRQGGSIGCCWWLGGWYFLWENNGKTMANSGKIIQWSDKFLLKNNLRQDVGPPCIL